MRDALSRGFRQIASYIFGRNMDEPGASAESDPRFLDGSAMGGGSGAKIAMTSPVVTEMPPLLPSASAAAAAAAGPSSSSSALHVFFFFSVVDKVDARGPRRHARGRGSEPLGPARELRQGL